MPRFYIDPKNVFRDRFVISDENICNHLRQVLRVRKGSSMDLFDGTGYEYKAEIGYMDKKQVSGVILEKVKIEEPYPYIILAQAFPKAGKADEIVRMNTEVGVSEFIFFKSEYSVPPVDSYDEKKLERLRRVVIEAARQSERSIMPKINTLASLDEVFKVKADIKLLLHSRDAEGVKSINKVIGMDGIKLKGKKTLVIIGPEGGFSPKELEKANSKANAKAGAKITLVHLPLPIMRTETAGVVLSGVLIISMAI